MKKILVFSVLQWGLLSLMAQIPTNFTATDCNGVSKTIHTELGTTGKAIIIMSKGTDCSSCISSAPGWQNWAAQNTSKVQVWGAITYRFNPANFSPACTATLNWKNNYGWNDIFTFPDLNRDFVEIAMPRYYVYSPQDSSIVYAGFNANQARNVALQSSVVGISEFDLLKDINIQWHGKKLVLDQLPADFQELGIYQMNGQLLAKHRGNSSRIEHDFTGKSSGIYLLNFQSRTGRQSLKIALP